MTDLINLIPDLLGGLWPKLAALGGLVAAAFAFVWKNRRDAVKLDRAKQKEKDHAKADDIRDRVERDLPKRVRDFDDAGFRD